MHHRRASLPGSQRRWPLPIDLSNLPATGRHGRRPLQRDVVHRLGAWSQSGEDRTHERPALDDVAANVGFEELAIFPPMGQNLR